MTMVNLASKKVSHLSRIIAKINCLKLMKRVVEIWLKLADGDRKEAKNQKRVFEWHSKGAHIHRRPRLTIDQQYVHGSFGHTYQRIVFYSALEMHEFLYLAAAY